MQNEEPSVEQDLKDAFTRVAGSMFRFIAHGQITEPSMVESMEDFLGAHARACHFTGDARGMPLEIPMIMRDERNSDERINRILRGSLMMVAAMFEHGIGSPAYYEAQKNIVEGVERIMDEMADARLQSLIDTDFDDIVSKKKR